MQQATHIHSGMKGTIIGYHADKKAHLIKLPTGQKQYWKEEAIIKEGVFDMTDKIMFKLTGQKNKWYHVIERYFNTVEEAYEYLAEMKTLNDIRDFSSAGTSASMTNGWNISSNYDIREILKKKPPTKDLPDDMPFDLRKSLGRDGSLRVPSNHKPSPDNMIRPTSKKSFTGKTVKLQDLTKDPRKARVVLRDLVRKKKIVKPGRWEWDEGSPDLAIVRAALNK